ncbi:MAG TPA: hypothetical protein DD861_01135 [Erythrobacter sp.]|nr:hypothetical protein [Erythrobacter sp.]
MKKPEGRYKPLRMTSIYAHFAKQTQLPVRLSDIHDFIMGKGVVARMERYACPTKNGLVGIFQSFYDLAPPYQEAPLIVRIGYPASATEGAQRLVQAKEMLHALDPDNARSPTPDAVAELIDDLLFEAAEREIGVPAQVDHLNFINALAVLMPLAALDLIRPAYKKGKVTLEQVAEEARLPAGFVSVTLADEWEDIAKTLL